MEQHTKKHTRRYFCHLKNALGDLKIAMRGAFLNIKSMLALQIIYSIFYTLIEYSLFKNRRLQFFKFRQYRTLSDHTSGNRNASDFIFDCMCADLS